MNIIEKIKKVDPKTAFNVMVAIGTGVVAVVGSLKEQKEQQELDELKKTVKTLVGKE